MVGRGIPLRPAFLETLPEAFRSYYAARFVGDRMIYGHWSMGLYTRAVGSYHKQIAVARPLELDTAIEQYVDARHRRVAGALPAMLQTIADYKRQAVLQTFTNAPYDADLPDHTPHRESDSIALAVMCGYAARPNDLGHAEPLPLQVRALAGLIAEACLAVGSPVERFMTHSEAADNLDFPSAEDAGAPHPPYGFRSTREAWDLEAWIESPSLTVFPPLAAARPDWQRLGDWLREAALRDLAERTRGDWAE